MLVFLVTHRDVNQAVTFLSGHDRTGLAPSAINWQGHCGWQSGHRYVYGNETSARDCRKLISAGRDPYEPVAIVSNATQANMRILETSLIDAAKGCC